MLKFCTASVLACAVALPAGAVELQYSLPFNDANEFTRIGVDWTERVAAATDGEVVFKPMSNSALVSVPESLDAVSDGVVPSVQAVASAMASVIPAFSYLEMSMSVPVDHAEEVMGKIYPDVEKLLEPFDVKVLWMMPAFGGGVACKEDYIKDPADLSGLKVRVAGRWQAKQSQAMGALPVSLPGSDIYTAWQNGTIDCTQTATSIYVSSSLYEVAPYYYDYSWAGQALITIVGNDAWNRLTDEQKQAVEKVSQEMTGEGTKRLYEKNQEEIAAIKEQANYTEVDSQVLLERWDPIFKEAMAEVPEDDQTGRHFVETLYSYTQ